MSATLRQRVQDLLASRATQGLEAAERRELDAILQAHSDWDDEGFERAAAALDLALQGEPPELPARLRRRLLSQSRRWLPPAAGSR